MSGISLLLSDSRGVYIPRDFVNNFDLDKWHVKEDYQDVLSSLDNEWYWDVWDEVLNNAYFVDDSGNKWVLHQDGDLWAICYELMTDKEKLNFCFED